MGPRRVFCCAVFRRLAVLLVATGIGVQAPVSADVVKLTPNLRLNALSARPDSDLVQLSDGKQVRLGDMRRAAAAAGKLRSAPPTAVVPPAFRFKPAATGTRIADAGDLAAALKRPDSDTLVLPSGRRITVGQLRFLQPRVEMRLGRPLAATPQRSAPGAAPVRVTAASDWKAILKRSDATVLESPSGKQVTVGELKQAIQRRQLPLTAAPAGKR